MKRYMHRLIVPFWMESDNVRMITDTSSVGIVNLVWLANTPELKTWVVHQAPKLGINGESLERMAAMYTLKEFAVKLKFSGLPPQVTELRKLAEAYHADA